MKNRQKHLAALVLAMVVAVLAGCKKEMSSQNQIGENDETIIYEEKQQWPYTYTGYETFYEYRYVVDHLGHVKN